MQVLLTRNVLIAGKPVAAGEVAEVSDTDARYLIAIGKATTVPGDVSEEGISEAIPGGKRPHRKK